MRPWWRDLNREIEALETYQRERKIAERAKVLNLGNQNNLEESNTNSEILSESEKSDEKKSPPESISSQKLLLSIIEALVDYNYTETLTTDTARQDFAILYFKVSTLTLFNQVNSNIQLV